jgi:hypothetical protein
MSAKDALRVEKFAPPRIAALWSLNAAWAAELWKSRLSAKQAHGMPKGFEKHRDDFMHWPPIAADNSATIARNAGKHKQSHAAMLCVGQQLPTPYWAQMRGPPHLR